MESVKKMSFEEALVELENIVRRLEEGKVPLEDAIQAYERGTSLRRHCEDKLAQAKMRIDKISIEENGNVALEPFDPLPHDA